VDDLYESYIEESGNPLKYVRKINEGGYVKTKRVFNQSDNSVLLKIIKIETKKLLLLKKYSRYIICVLLLRNYPNIDKISPGGVYQYVYRR
jgi:hypothetical protein